jgi:hypothetical protein
MKKEEKIMKRECHIEFISIKLVTAFVMGTIMIFTIGCASTAEIAHKPIMETLTTSGEYETPGVLSARSILPPELIKSEYHVVLNEVVTYDFTNYFTITSPFGQFTAQGEDMLRVRVQEIRAIAVLEETKKSKAFGKAAKQAALSPVKGAVSLITHPVNTVTGVPKGVWRFMTRVGEMAKGGRRAQEDSEVKELIGFSKIKRMYAYKLGVNVYSSNETLQKKLNSVSWAGFAGGAGVKLLTMPISGPAGMVIKGTSFADRMNKTLRDNTPEDLRKMNRKMLQQMGVRESIINQFLSHPMYSPRHETILVHALVEMEGVKNREAFIKQSLFAEYEEDAFFYQQLAEMLAGYHTVVKPISELIPVRRVVAGYTVDRAMVATIPLDYVYWTERAALGSEAFAQVEFADRPVTRKELWFTGSVSPMAKQGFEARGIVVNEHTRDILLPPLD